MPSRRRCSWNRSTSLGFSGDDEAVVYAHSKFQLDFSSGPGREQEDGEGEDTGPPPFESSNDEKTFLLGRQRRAKVDESDLVLLHIKSDDECLRLVGNEVPLSDSEQQSVDLGQRIHFTSFSCAAANATFTRLATGNDDEGTQQHSVRLWDINKASIRAGFGNEIARIEFESPVHSITFDRSGRRLATLAEDGALQLLWVLPPQQHGPPWFADFLEFCSMKRFDPKTGRPGKILPEQLTNTRRELHNQLEVALTSRNHTDYTKILGWSLTRGSDRTIDPFTTMTFRQAADAVLRWDLPDELLAYRLDCTHPLVHIAVARYYSDHGADVLRDYDLRKLPNETAICVRAAEILIEQEDTHRATLALEKAAALEPNHPDVLRLRESLLK